jgi:hypothetical protein
MDTVASEQGIQRQQQQEQQPAADSPALRQQYMEQLKPLLFQSVPLRDHYFREQAAAGNGEPCTCCLGLVQAGVRLLFPAFQQANWVPTSGRCRWRERALAAHHS